MEHFLGPAGRQISLGISASIGFTFSLATAEVRTASWLPYADIQVLGLNSIGAYMGECNSTPIATDTLAQILM